VLSLRNLAPLFTLLVLGEFAAAQTVVQSTFLNRFPAANYDDPSNWSPGEVPNNTALKNYNVLINVGYAIEVNIDATISNLVAYGSFTGLNVRENLCGYRNDHKRDRQRIDQYRIQHECRGKFRCRDAHELFQQHAHR
jgi:hypothetical protein